MPPPAGAEAELPDSRQSLERCSAPALLAPWVARRLLDPSRGLCVPTRACRRSLGRGQNAFRVETAQCRSTEVSLPIEKPECEAEGGWQLGAGELDKPRPKPLLRASTMSNRENEKPVQILNVSSKTTPSKLESKESRREKEKLEIPWTTRRQTWSPPKRKRGVMLQCTIHCSIAPKTKASLTDVL